LGELAADAAIVVLDYTWAGVSVGGGGQGQYEESGGVKHCVDGVLSWMGGGGSKDVGIWMRSKETGEERR
jgi:hypothetical protein